MSKHLSPAYQLYSAREDASNDLEGVLDQLSRMGYEGVEFAGFFEKTAKEVRKLLKHTGLKAVSSHVPLQQIRDDMQSVLDYHEELECGCIAVPYLAEEDRPGQPGFARVLETLYTFGRQCKKRGIVLLYHNHDCDFAPTPEGLVPEEELLARTSILLEVDTYWTFVAKQNPVEFIRQHKDRIRMIHLKDGMGDHTGKSLGQGVAPVKEVRQAAIELGFPMIVESEGLDPTGLEEVKRCIEFLKEEDAK